MPTGYGARGREGAIRSARPVVNRAQPKDGFIDLGLKSWFLYVNSDSQHCIDRFSLVIEQS